MSNKWWKEGEPRTRSQPTLLVSPGDFTNRRRKSSLVERSPIDSTRPLRRSSPRSRLSRARSNSPLVTISKRKTAKMPVKRSPVKPRTPQGQLIDVEGGETEAEVETITSANAEILQRELQNIPQLTLRGDFQSPPTQALGATAGNGNGNGATAGNGNGATGGNGNGNQIGTIPKVAASRGETEVMQRERMAQEEKEKERIESEKREEEVRKKEQLREQDEIRWKAAMEEKKKRQREADIVHERAERNRMEYEERERRRHEAEEELNRQREEDFQKRLKPVSPFIAITQTVPGGILKTPRTNASTPRDLVVRSNVATPSSTGYTTPSRPASTV